MATVLIALGIVGINGVLWIAIFHVPLLIPVGLLISGISFDTLKEL